MSAEEVRTADIADLEAEIAEYEGLTLEQCLVPSNPALITARNQVLHDRL
jgi:hypothetical protein